MKLSKTGWNNVIIFSVMSIILMINATNNKLFPDDQESKSERLILPEHSVILTMSIEYSSSQMIAFERIGRGWQLTAKGLLVDKTEQQIDQMMFAWQQSVGLTQAAEVVIDNVEGIKVEINIAGQNKAYVYTLYPLNDQLLMHLHQEGTWLALPAALAQQLLPVTR